MRGLIAIAAAIVILPIAARAEVLKEWPKRGSCAPKSWKQNLPSLRRMTTLPDRTCNRSHASR
jgi:hypothetical protein